ncbi:hypothetical protein ABQE44_25585 [Mycolicibacterium sp. XJ2546]
MKQADIRRRRRAHMPIVHDGGWSLSREIAEVAGALAARIAARPMPLQFRRQVLAYADAAHEAVGAVTGWVAERDARRRTEHLADDEGKRRYAVTTLIDLAPRPALPTSPTTCWRTRSRPARLSCAGSRRAPTGSNACCARPSTGRR